MHERRNICNAIEQDKEIADIKHVRTQTKGMLKVLVVGKIHTPAIYNRNYVTAVILQDGAKLNSSPT